MTEHANIDTAEPDWDELIRRLQQAENWILETDDDTGGPAVLHSVGLALRVLGDFETDDDRVRLWAYRVEHAALWIAWSLEQGELRERVWSLGAERELARFLEARRREREEYEAWRASQAAKHKGEEPTT
jgi:hypothetical protein